jgi:hypothetical protein
MGEPHLRMLSADDRLDTVLRESERIRHEIDSLNESHQIWELRRAIHQEAQRRDPLYGYELPNA